ncbi:iron-containing alcohol dehydrogenase [candidate division WOR-3 bacterium]|nr:iron-containing alcohol dehydrogenase [candidate division WOR-3 bacterium]
MENTVDFLSKIFAVSGSSSEIFKALSVPPRIVSGIGVFDIVAEIAKSFGTNALLVTGSKSFEETKFYNDFMREKEKTGLHIFRVKIPYEPTDKMIDGIKDEFRNEIICSIIAVGGGSVLDAGKALSVLMNENGPTKDFLENRPSPRIFKKDKIPFIAVPTTSGTGSEATKNAVINVLGEELKASLRGDRLIPDVAVLDPRLTYSCPVNTAFSSGMDALTQLAESFISVRATEATDLLAGQGFKMAFSAMKHLTGDFSDEKAKQEMSLSVFFSGVTLANAGLGTVHGFAAVIGGMFGAPHGFICANLLVHCLRKTFYECAGCGDEKTVSKLRLLAGFSEGYDSPADTEKLFENIDCLLKKTGLAKLDEYGVEEKYFSVITKNTNVKNSPCKLTKDDLIEILEQENRR